MIALRGAALRVLLAAPSPSPTPAKGGEGVKSGPIGLAVILVLCVVAYFLFKSMSKHLRRVREDFPVEPKHGGGHQAATVPPPADEPAEPDDVQSAKPPPGAS